MPKIIVQQNQDVQMICLIIDDQNINHPLT